MPLKLRTKSALEFDPESELIEPSVSNTIALPADPAGPSGPVMPTPP